MTSDYIYQNNADKFHMVKWNLDGEFVEIGGNKELADETLCKMENMDDVEGWALTDEETLMGL
jgi:hypothetical protein